MGVNKAGFLDLNVRLSDRFATVIGLSSDKRYVAHTEEHFKDLLADAFRNVRANTTGRLRVLELGCGQKSFIVSAGFDKTAFDYELVGLDVSAQEIALNRDIDRAITFDACNPGFRETFEAEQGTYDLIVSHAFLEHVPRPEVTHALVQFLLKDNGESVHFFPSLYDPTLLAGHLLPNSIAQAILFAFEPFRKKTGKFKTYYRFCRGNRTYLERVFKDAGFELRDLRVMYGSCYLARCFPAKAILDCFYLLCLRCGWSLFASNVCTRMVKLP